MGRAQSMGVMSGVDADEPEVTFLLLKGSELCCDGYSFMVQQD